MLCGILQVCFQGFENKRCRGYVSTHSLWDPFLCPWRHGGASVRTGRQPSSTLHTQSPSASAPCPGLPQAGLARKQLASWLLAKVTSTRERDMGRPRAAPRLSRELGEAISAQWVQSVMGATAAAMETAGEAFSEGGLARG